MTRFDQLGIREELLSILEEEGIERPTALQQAAIPVLRRGGNLVARASTGAGKTLAYGLGVLDRLAVSAPDESVPDASETGESEVEAEEPETGARCLVLTSAPEIAEDIALALVPYAQAADLQVSVPGGVWGTRVSDAELIVSTPEQAEAAVRDSDLKLDRVDAVVIDDISGVEALGGLATLETLLDNLPRDAQRIVFGARFSDAVTDLIDRRVKRALHYPPESAVPEEGAPPAQEGEVGYVLVPGPERLDTLARIIAEGEEATPVLFFRSDERAAEIAELLAVRGFVAGEPGDEDIDLAITTTDTTREALLGEVEGDLGPTVSWDVPPDEETLRARHAGDANALVLVSPRELPHLQEIARRAHLGLRTIALPVETGAATIRAFRTELRRAIREYDLGAQMLLLEPLFEEFSAAEVAAGASALLREHARPAAAQPQAGAPAATPQPRSAAAPASTEAGRAPATWARLFVGVGGRDGVRPGDLVGAIAGETNIPGSRVGRIDVRDTFSIVEVQADVAEAVIRAVNGTTIKGRSVRVDYDRGGDRMRRDDGARRGGREGARPPVRRPPPR